MSRLRRLALILVAITLVTAACGDDSGSSTGTAEDGGEASSAADGDSPDVDVDVPGVSDECELALEASLEASQAFGAALTPGAGDLSASAEFFEQAVAAAPEEVRDDFAIVAEGITEFAEALEDAGGDLSDPATFADPAVSAALQEAAQAFEDPAFVEAGENINAWVEANCGG
jgi:ABC-type glycerol-3-phosphate transport system substrate-binding protein